MKTRRILALIERDFRIAWKGKARLAESFYFPLISILLWSFFVTWSQSYMLESAIIILAVNFFWGFGSSVQETVNLQMMEDRWSESIRQMMITPLRPQEYVTSKILYSLIISSLSLLIMTSVIYFGFGFTSIFENLLHFGLIVIFMAMSSIGISLIVGSFIIRLGNEYSFLSWTSFTFFILLSAPFFPISVYPKTVQIVSRLIPFSWIFESIRMLMENGFVTGNVLTNAFILSGIYMLVSFPLWFVSLNKARENGKLVKIW